MILIGMLDNTLRKEIGELLLRCRGEDCGGPEFWGKESICLGEGVIHSHGQVTTCAGVPTGRGIAVLNASHVKQLLGDKRSDEP